MLVASLFFIYLFSFIIFHWRIWLFGEDRVRDDQEDKILRAINKLPLQLNNTQDKWNWMGLHKWNGAKNFNKNSMKYFILIFY